MADPAAIMRAAQAGPKPMGGMPPEMGDMPPQGQAQPEGGEGLEVMVGALKGVGEFLKSQGPQGQEAMGHFQALLQSMSQIGGAGPEQTMPEEEPKAPGRIHESQFPGVQVM